MELEKEEGLEQEVVEESFVINDWEKVVHSIRKRVVMSAGGVGQDCAQGEELFGGEREAGGVDTML